jgi:hypothetical protein
MRNAKPKDKRLLTRRELLGVGFGGTLSALAVDPLKMLTSGLASGLISAAQAQTSAPSKRLFTLTLNQAPDQAAFIFTPRLFPTLGFVGNSGLVNAYDANLNPIFDVVPISVGGQTYYLPPLWATSVPQQDPDNPNNPHPTEPWAPASRVLQNLYHLCGITHSSDGHEADRLAIYRPSGSRYSLEGLAAYARSSNDLLPPIAFNDAPGFSAPGGIGRIVPRFGTNPLVTLLDPFNSSRSASVWQNQATLDPYIQTAIRELASFAQTHFPGAAELFSMRNRADTLIRQGVVGLDAKWTELITKYTNVVSRAKTRLSAPLIGTTGTIHINDVVIPNNGSNNVCSNGATTSASDLRDVIGPNTDIAGLAQQFAIAEYLLVSNLSSSVHAEIGLSPFTNMNTSSGAWPVDEHSVGNAAKIQVHFFFWRAVTACLNELIQSLNRAGIFSETAIVVSSEFPRAHQGQGSQASDHLWWGQALNVFTGQVSAPIFQGSIHIDQYPGRRYAGTIGGGAPVTINGTERVVQMADAVSTVAQIIGVESPVPRATPLVSNANGSIVPFFGRMNR